MVLLAIGGAILVILGIGNDFSFHIPVIGSFTGGVGGALIAMDLLNCGL